MNQEYSNQIQDVARLVRKQSLRNLGEAPFVDKLTPLLKKFLHIPVEDAPKIMVGDAVISIFKKAIERIGSDSLGTPKNSSYIYLKQYLLNGKEWELIANELGYSRSKFYEIRKIAIEHLAAEIWHMLEEEKMEIISNLGRAPYFHFINRFDENGQDYIRDRIFPELREGRHWIYGIIGDAGVGKSSIAYATADLLVKEAEKHNFSFEAVIWVKIRQDSIKIHEGLLEISSTTSSMSKVYDEIGRTLNTRRILSLAYEEKKQLTDALLGEFNCLVILDNLDSEFLSDDFRNEIFDFIQSFPHPNKVLVTMRKDQAWDGLKTIEVSRMNPEEARTFIQNQASERETIPLTNEEFEKVYEKTLGYPLLMKFVLGQLRVFKYKLSDVLNLPFTAENILSLMYEKSYDRLPIDSKKLLFALTLFPNPVTPEALEYVSAISGHDQVIRLGQLYRGHLVEKSLVDNLGSMGYSLLPFVKEYLREKTNSEEKLNGETVSEFLSENSIKVANYYIKYLEKIEDSKDSTLLFVKIEKDNMLNALTLSWKLNSEKFVRLFDLIGISLGTLRYLETRIDWANKVVRFLEEREMFEEANWYKVRDIAWSLITIGTRDSRQKGIKILNDTLNISKENGWAKNEALALRNLARLHHDDGDFSSAQEMFEESISIWSDENDQFWKAITLRGQADILISEEHFEEAESLYNVVFDTFVGINDLNGQIICLCQLAKINCLKGEEKRAFDLINEAKEFSVSITPPSHSAAFAAYVYSQILEKSGKREESCVQARTAQDLYTHLGMNYIVEKIEKQITDVCDSHLEQNQN